MDLTEKETNIYNNVDANLLNTYKHKIDSLNTKKRKELEASLCWLFLTDNLKKKRREELQQIMKTNDKFAVIFGLIGIVTNILSSSLYIKFKQSKSKKLLIFLDEKVDEILISIEMICYQDESVKTLRLITLLTTLILCYFLIRHYCLRLKFEKFKQIADISDTIFSSRLFFGLLLEILVCLIHSPPFLHDIKMNFSNKNGTENYVDFDLFFSSIIPLRIYLLLRYYLFYSSWADDRAEKICNEYNTMGGISFAIKAELKERPYTVVGFLMLLSILIFGYALRNIEVSFSQDVPIDSFQDWTSELNGFWCIIITILTVGYGDFYPQTNVGRVIVIIACLWGTFLISLIVVSLTISVEFTLQQRKAYNELNKRKLYNDFKTIAIRMIRYGVRLKIFSSNKDEIKDYKVKRLYDKNLNEFKLSLYEFRNSRNIIKNIEHEDTTENILYRLNENVSEEMENLIHISNNEVNTLLSYLKFSESIQDEIKLYIDKLDKITKVLSQSIDN